MVETEKYTTEKKKHQDTELISLITETLTSFKIEIQEKIEATGLEITREIQEIKMLAQSNKKQIDETINQIQQFTSKAKVIYQGERSADLDVLDIVSKVPSHLRKTFLTVMKFEKEVTAEEVAEETGRSRPLESDYLNQLERKELISKRKDGKKVLFFKFTNRDENGENSEYEENSSEKFFSGKKNEITRTHP